MDLYSISEKQNSFDTALNIYAPVIVLERKRLLYRCLGLLKTKIWPKRQRQKKQIYLLTLGYSFERKIRNYFNNI